MSDPYRAAEDRLGADERESEAVRKLGQWRDRTRTVILAIFGIGGVAVGGVAYWLVQEAQFRSTGYALVKVNALSGAAAWGAMFVVGWLVSRVVVRARMPAKVDQLAQSYDVPRERIEATAELLRAL